MRFTKTALLLTLIPFLYANELTTDNFLNLDTLAKKDRSLEKDFYIWKYLDDNSINYQNSIDALGQSYNVNNELFYKYAQKLGDDETLAVAQCMQANEKELVQTYSDCIRVGLTLKKALRLTPLELNSVIEKVKDSYPTFARELQIINSSIPFTKIVSSNKNIIYDIYLNSSSEFIFNKLNYRLPNRTIGKIIDDEKFEKFLKITISNPKLNFLQSSFFNINDLNLSSNSSFLLAMNRVLNRKLDDKTIEYLENAYNKASNELDKEKILFWKYQISKDENYLRALTTSTNINIYTIFAKQFFKEEFIITDDFKTTLDEYLINCTENKKVLYSSIAKELSDFNQNKIDFLNLGIFQINVKEVEKIADENDLIFDYSKLFDIKENLLYFNSIFQEIETNYPTLLFQIYAFKDGIKPFQKSLDNNLFDSNNPLEPYLSLEIFKNEKTNKFVKRVLVDYIVYNKIYKKEDLILDDFLKKSIEPLDYLDF